MRDLIPPNLNWNLRYDGSKDPTSATDERLQSVLLQEIRDLLQRLVNVLECSQTQKIPVLLNNIEHNTKKQPRRKKKRAS